MIALARRYARALFEVAEEQGATDAVAADLEALAQGFADGAARDVLSDPTVPRNALAEALSKLAADAHPLTRNTLGVVLERRREALLPELHGAFAALVRAARGQMVGVLESAQPLDPAAVAEIEKKTGAALGAAVSLTLRVAPELIGGVRVRVGNTLYDGSVKTALEELERKLMEAPLP